MKYPISRAPEFSSKCYTIVRARVIGAAIINKIITELRLRLHGCVFAMNPYRSTIVYGTLCGTQQDLAAALTIIEAEGPPRGLFLNRVKSFIHSPDNCSVTHPLLCGIPTSSDGFTLLGSPVGPNSFCEDIFSKRVSKIADTLSKLEDLEDSQMETALLRSCLALPKVAYLLRTCPPALFQQSLGSFDHIA